MLHHLYTSTDAFSPAMSQDVQQDLAGPLHVLAALFNPNTPFSMHHRFSPLPITGHQEPFQLAPCTYAVPSMPLFPPPTAAAVETPAVIGPQQEHQQQQEEDSLAALPEPALPQFCHIMNNINAFGNSAGIEVIIRSLCGGAGKCGEEEMAGSTATSIWKHEIGGIGAYGKNHIAGVITDSGIGVGGGIVKEHVAS